MGSDAAVAVAELPSLPPIKTALKRDRSLEGPPKAVNCEEQVEEGECVTPTSEEHVLKAASMCPPAPRKPRPAKRTMGPRAKGFHPVPRDLTSIFLTLPPKKRIRVG